jgi:hypothetical protein
MTIRTHETTVTFRKPFKLRAFDTPQPAGTYRLVTEEEQILGLSFLAYQRTATMLHLKAPNGSHHVFMIDPSELATALEADAAA